MSSDFKLGDDEGDGGDQEEKSDGDEGDDEDSSDEDDKGGGIGSQVEVEEELFHKY